MKATLLVKLNGIEDSTWQGFKELCSKEKGYNLPYNTLKGLPFPRKWREFEIIKLPFRCRGQENE